MQWPPTRPGVNRRKFHLVAAAANTSRVGMPSRSKIIASSFISAMLRSRCVFSMTLAASATSIETGTIEAGLDDLAINRSHSLQRLPILAGDDFHDRLEAVLAVAGIDPLG